MGKKVAYITGASRGIGAATAEKFAKEGYHLVLIARKEKKLQEKAKELEEAYGIRCLALSGDVSEEAFVKDSFVKLEETFGSLDILINNAGISYIGLFTEMEVTDWNQIMNTNLTSVFLCCKYGAKLMLQRKQGKIINISSVWGNVGASCEVAYSASKSGINGFTKALGKELAPSNIQVNAIAFGAIDTDMNQCYTEEEKQVLCEEIPMGRFGTTKEAAEMIYSLVQTPEYLTGQVITMDGGWT